MQEDKTMVHPQTGQILKRDYRDKRVSFTGKDEHAGNIYLAGWYPEKDVSGFYDESESLHSIEDIEEALKAFAEYVREHEEAIEKFRKIVNRD